MPTASSNVRMLLAAGLVLAALASLDPPASRAGTWQELPSISECPGNRMDHVMVADPLGGRLIMFGGMHGQGYRDMWQLRPADEFVWQPVTPLGEGPPAAAGHGAIYDPEDRRLLVFGGQTGPQSFLNDVWELDLTTEPPTWALLTVDGPLPPPRRSPAVAYDPVNRRLLVYGGYDGGIRGDMWALGLYGTPAWTELAGGEQTPGPRFRAVVAFDLDAKRLVLMGGVGDGLEHDDVWSYACAGIPGWTELEPAGERPAARSGHAGYLDPDGHDLVIFGGEGETILDDVWRLELGFEPAWTEVTPSAPAPCARTGHTAVYWPDFGDAIVFGGYAGEPTYYLGDSWRLHLGDDPAWTLIPTFEGRRYGHAAVYDPVGDRLLMVGGSRADGRGNDVWQLSLEATPAWSVIEAAGTGPVDPEPRTEHTVVLDELHRRLVLYGGYGEETLDDVWTLSLEPVVEWRQLEFDGPVPPPRGGHSAIYDAANQRMVVFGGYSEATGTDSDTWTLSLDDTPTWQQLDLDGAPPSRDCHAAVYDPVRQQMLVIMGLDNDYELLGDVWALSLGEVPTWQELSIGGTWPDARCSHAAAYDPVGDRVLVHGGDTFDVSYADDLWSLEIGAGLDWVEIDQGDLRPDPRERHVAVMDLADDRLVIFGGHGDMWPPFGDAWAFGDIVTAAPGGRSTTRTSLLLGPPHPNPLIGRTTIEFALPAAAPARVEIVDLAGRRVRVLCDEVRPAGYNAVTWDGRSDDGRQAASGVYLFRLQAGGQETRGRMVLVR